QFTISEIEQYVDIASSTLRRYIKLWCNKGYLKKELSEKFKNGGHNTYYITRKLEFFFNEYLAEVINIFYSTTANNRLEENILKIGRLKSYE
ncbi:MAG: hypothetical protein ACFFCI_10970, partial [Promethearchaeota archaeon]